MTTAKEDTIQFQSGGDETVSFAESPPPASSAESSHVNTSEDANSNSDKRKYSYTPQNASISVGGDLEQNPPTTQHQEFDCIDIGPSATTKEQMQRSILFPSRPTSFNAKHENYDFIFKIVLLGDSGVGKTNLVLRFQNNDFHRSSPSTIGVDFSTKTVQIRDSDIESIDNDNSNENDNGNNNNNNNRNRNDRLINIKAHIWDTSGQERYRSITSSYYRGAVGALLVYDITNRNTFDHISMWMQELEENANANPIANVCAGTRSNRNSNCLMMLVGNKMDLDRQRTVSVRDGRAFARKNGMAFIETSALDSIGVDLAFQKLLQGIYATHMRKQLKNPRRRSSARSTGSARKRHTQLRGEPINLKRDWSGDGTPAKTKNEMKPKNGCC